MLWVSYSYVSGPWLWHDDKPDNDGEITPLMQYALDFNKNEALVKLLKQGIVILLERLNTRFSEIRTTLFFFFQNRR